MAAKDIPSVHLDPYSIPHRNGTDENFSQNFNTMREFLQRGFALTDLQGLELMGQLLYQIANHRRDSAEEFTSISIVFEQNKLKEMVQLLMNFQPMRCETAAYHVSICKMQNFENCFSTILDYIEQISSRLIVMVKTSDIKTERSSFLLQLERVKFYVNNLKTRVTEAFQRFPVAIQIPSEGRCEFVSSYLNALYVPKIISSIFEEFPEPLLPLPPWLISTSSQSVVKIWLAKLEDLRASAKYGVCCVCLKKVKFILNLSVMPGCDHVACTPCLTKSLQKKGSNEWACPGCGLIMTNYSSVTASGDRVVSLLIPPHSEVMSVALFPNTLTRKPQGKPKTV